MLPGQNETKQFSDSDNVDPETGNFKKKEPLEGTKSIENIEIGANNQPTQEGANGVARWEMFPSQEEQEALTQGDPEQLAKGLWQSGEFVFSAALPEIARNVSVDKAVQIARSALVQFPNDHQRINDALSSIIGTLAKWSEFDQKAQSYEYTKEQTERHKGLMTDLINITKS